MSGKTIGPNIIGDRGQPPLRRTGERVKPTRLGEPAVIRSEQGRADPEQGRAAGAKAVTVGMLVEQRGIAVLKAGKRLTRDATRKQFVRRCLKPWFGRRGMMIEPLQCLAPPRQTDRPERRLGRVRHHLGHDVIDREQGIEGGPELDWPVEPDQIAIPQRVNDR